MAAIVIPTCCAAQRISESQKMKSPERSDVTATFARGIEMGLKRLVPMNCKTALAGTTVPGDTFAFSATSPSVAPARSGDAGAAPRFLWPPGAVLRGVGGAAAALLARKGATARSSRSLGTNLTMKHSQNLSSSWKEHELVFLSEMY